MFRLFLFTIITFVLVYILFIKKTHFGIKVDTFEKIHPASISS